MLKLILGIFVLATLVIVPSLAADPGGPVVTLGAGGDQVYTTGETILFSGTNTAGPTTYLFVKGPGIPEGGARLSNLSIPAVSGNSSTFMEVPVDPDHTYSAEWDPAAAAPGGTPAGSYTVFASAAPVSFSDLADTPFDSVNIFLLGGPSAVPLPTTPLPVTIPPTKAPFPFPTAQSPSGTPVTIPPTQDPRTLPTVPSPSDPMIPVPPTQTPVPLPTPPVPFPLPSASGSGSMWQFPIGTAGFESWSDWLFDQLKDFFLP